MFTQKQINHYCNPQFMSEYLQKQTVLSEGDLKILKELIDDNEECWQMWNKVRWDAAMQSRGVRELKEYLGSEFRPYYDSSWALAQEWNAARRDDQMSVQDFYLHTSNYLYNSTIFYESGDREDLHTPLMELVSRSGAKWFTDFGCGVGNDGLRMLEEGLGVNFVDFDSPSTAFLRWRLQKRKIPESQYKIIDVRETVHPEFRSDFFSAVDVFEHMINVQDIFHYITEETRIVSYFIDADDDAGGRHPFHFPFSESKIAPQLNNLGFVKESHRLLSVWKNRLY